MMALIRIQLEEPGAAGIHAGTEGKSLGTATDRYSVKMFDFC